MKTPKKVSIKVQRIIGTVFRMLIQNTNIIFSRMSIIFFIDARNAIYNCTFWEKIIFAFFCRKKKDRLYRICRKHTHTDFFEKYHLSLSVSYQYHIFEKKESFVMIQEISCSSAMFQERPSFQNIWKKKIQFFVQYLDQVFPNMFSYFPQVQQISVLEHSTLAKFTFAGIFLFAILFRYTFYHSFKAFYRLTFFLS